MTYYMVCVLIFTPLVLSFALLFTLHTIIENQLHLVRLFGIVR